MQTPVPAGPQSVAAAHAEARRDERVRRLGRVAYSASIHLVLGVAGLLFLFPFAWMVSTSLKEPSGIFIYPPELIPNPFRFANYPEAMTSLPFGRYFRTCTT